MRNFYKENFQEKFNHSELSLKYSILNGNRLDFYIISYFKKNLTDNREGLLGNLERAKGFEPSTSTLAKMQCTADHDNILYLRQKKSS